MVVQEKLTEKEKEDFRAAVRLLTEERKWTFTALAKELGYTSPAPISMIMKDPNRAPGRDKYERLMALLDSAEGPPEPPVRRRPGRRYDTIDGEKLIKFQNLINMLRDRLTMDEIAHGIGYAGAGSLRQAISRGKIPEETYQNLVAFVESENVRKISIEKGQLPPQPEVVRPRRSSAPINTGRTTLDYLRVAGEHLRLARNELLEAIDSGTVQYLVRPGLEKVARQIEELEKHLKIT